MKKRTRQGAPTDLRQMVTSIRARLRHACLARTHQRFPFRSRALGRLLPQLLSDPLDGDQILQRNLVVWHCFAPLNSSRHKIAGSSGANRDDRIKVTSVP